MKLRKWMTSCALLLLMSQSMASIPSVLAQETSDDHVIYATENQQISSHYTIHYQDEDMVVSLTSPQLPSEEENIENLTLSFHHFEEGSQTYTLQLTSPNLYEVRIPIKEVPAGAQISFQLTSNLQQVYHFTGIATPQQTSQNEPSSEPTPSTTDSTSQLSSSTTSTVTATVSDTQASTSTPEAASLPATVEVTYKQESNEMEVLVSNIDSSIRRLRIPIWSDDKGKDDLKWYTADRQADGTFRLTTPLKEHQYTAGLYYIHVYGEKAANQLVGLLSTTTTITLPATAGKITIDPKLDEKGNYFDVVISEVSSPIPIKSVRLPIWSEENGQDDLKWYTATQQADGTYRVSLPAQNHNYTIDNYQVHLYYELENHKTIGVTSTQTNVSLPKIALTTSTVKNTESAYEMTIQNVPSYFTTIKVPVWSDTNGQDDIKWYTATKQANGDFKVQIPLANHHFDSGLYQAHIYGESKLQKGLIGLDAASSFQVEKVANVQPSATLSVNNINTQQLRFDVIVSNIVAPSEVKEVKIPVWSDANGQDDIKWYTANRQDNGTFKVTVQASNHNYTLGKYHVHAYLVLSNKQMIGVGTTNLTLSAPTSSPTIQSFYQGSGNYQLTIGPVATAGQIQYAVWSETGGQDDIKWYTAQKSQSVLFTGELNVQNHSGSGRYQVHVYESLNGKMRGLGSIVLNVSKTQYTPVYYTQRDNRWTNQYYRYWTFGATGCVPTTLAMIFSGIKGGTITPVQVGDYLFNNTSEFNRGIFVGTSSQGIKLAATKWGLKASGVSSLADLETTLKKGYLIAAAVGPSKYIRAGGHEIALKGYQNGMTYVYDPYNPANNGWTSLQYLWSVKSTDEYTMLNQSPFIRITD